MLAQDTIYMYLHMFLAIQLLLLSADVIFKPLKRYMCIHNTSLLSYFTENVHASPSLLYVHVDTECVGVGHCPLVLVQVSCLLPSIKLVKFSLL